MKDIFADTGYWIALLNPRGELHLRARNLAVTLKGMRIIISEWVLIETLNGFAGCGPHLRSIAAGAVSALRSNSGALVEGQIVDSFSKALKLYRDSADKEWILTDCSSFLILRQHRIDSALTSDHHCEQSGFKALLR
jgi:predicted nucleic acid-binding protein